MFVDLKLETPNAHQNLVMTFSERQMIKHVKIIYQLVIYLQQLHVQLPKQEHVSLMQLKDQMIMPKPLFAIFF